jgi:hypothetical protein
LSRFRYLTLLADIKERRHIDDPHAHSSHASRHAWARAANIAGGFRLSSLAWRTCHDRVRSTFHSGCIGASQQTPEMCQKRP